MISPRLSSLIHKLRDRSGQSTIMLAMMMAILLGMTGFSLDVGRAYYTYKQLQATTDAAALAGANSIAAGTAISTATQYSAVSGNLNARASLPNTTMVNGYPKLLCLNTVTNMGESCSNASNANAIQVRQQIALPLIFMPILGQRTLTIGSVATASMKGSQREPYNVAVILDTTPSMGSTDSDSQCNTTRLACAEAGVQVLLQNLTPCAPNLVTCGPATNGNYQNPVDQVALYVFPPLYSATDVQNESNCSGTQPQVNYYNDIGWNGYSSTGTYSYYGQGTASTPSLYKIVDFSSDFKTSPNTTVLNPNSSLVKAVGGVSGCGMKTLENYTYIGGAIFAAGNDLIAQDQQNTSRQGVVVVITDGDMNAPSNVMPYASTTSGSYASSVNECQQAIYFAGFAGQYNVKVYAVAYGANDSGCSTDTSGPLAGITPCQTVQQLASSPQNFYSDYTSTGGSSDCVSASHSTANLNTIFQMIANDLSTSKLIPDNTT